MGSNDCSSSSTDMDDLQSNMTCLINMLKSTCPSVEVCSVLPRLNSIKTNCIIDCLNAELSVIATELECRYINIENAFNINGHYNYALFHDDVHLNNAGLKILAHELNVSNVKQNAWTPRTVDQDQYHSANHSSDSPRNLYPNRHRNNHSHRNTQSSYSGCYNCGEQNHNQSACHFNGPIECSACHQMGHKAKHHH